MELILLMVVLLLLTLFASEPIGLAFNRFALWMLLWLRRSCVRVVRRTDTGGFSAAGVPGSPPPLIGRR